MSDKRDFFDFLKITTLIDVLEWSTLSDDMIILFFYTEYYIFFFSFHLPQIEKPVVDEIRFWKFLDAHKYLETPSTYRVPLMQRKDLFSFVHCASCLTWIYLFFFRFWIAFSGIYFYDSIYALCVRRFTTLMRVCLRFG